MWPDFYYSQEDLPKDFNIKNKSIDNYKNLFSSYKYNFPSLEDALHQMYKSQNINEIKINQLTKDILDKCNKTIEKNFQKIKNKYQNISRNDAQIISSYTCESIEREYSPYRILNKNLVESDRQRGVQNVSKYLYILLKSLRKLPTYKLSNNDFLFRAINQKVNVSEKVVKVFWGFTSTSNDKETTFKFLDNNNYNKSGTFYKLYGDIVGYDIELFNSFGEKEILLEPERLFIVESVNYFNDVIEVTCEILNTPLILTENNYQQNMIIEENIESNEYNIDNNKNYINQFIAKIEMEYNISGIGILCNIPEKHIKVLLTYNHLINLNSLNAIKFLKLSINNKNINIDLKSDRYKYTDANLDITIIEILESDNIHDFIEIHNFLNSENNIYNNILSVCFNENKKINIIDNGIILSKNYNNNYICSSVSIKEGIAILKNDLKLMGLIKDNNNSNEIEIIPINKIVNNINFIKCTYLIDKIDLGKATQIINNKGKENYINTEIERKMKVIINGEIQPVINREKNLDYLTYIFVNDGKYTFYFISDSCLNNMSYMFYNCSSLTNIDLLSFNTNQVFDMSYMLYKCSSLINIDLSSFNTNQVTNMSYMFYLCSSFPELDLSKFNTNKVINMAGMFSYCNSLKNINLLSFNTKQVTDISNMFKNCSSLSEINLSSFNTNKVLYMEGMFSYCSSLKKIIFSSLFRTANAISMSYMFNDCTNLEELDLSLFEADNLKNISGMFFKCTALRKIDLSSFNINQNCNLYAVFFKCNSLNKIICNNDYIIKIFNNELDRRRLNE